jgi:hypothetical protein
MRKFGYSFHDLANMTENQIAFLIEGMNWETRELEKEARKLKARRRKF